MRSVTKGGCGAWTERFGRDRAELERRGATYLSLLPGRTGISASTCGQTISTAAGRSIPLSQRLFSGSLAVKNFGISTGIRGIAEKLILCGKAGVKTLWIEIGYMGQKS